MVYAVALLYIHHMHLSIDVYIIEYIHKVLGKKLYQIHLMFE
jgi:hypothetical protein